MRDSRIRKGFTKCEALRRGEEHNTVHHNRDCRKRIEKHMTEDKQLPEKLTEVEEIMNRYFARQVESADKDRNVSHDTNAAASDPH